MRPGVLTGVLLRLVLAGVGCRGSGPKAGLLRVTRGAGDAVAVDPTGGAPGRGAYLHPDVECVAAAFRRGGLAKGLLS